jgi:2-polyprenyl-3-methyl-5-hydroxy-6-metoxy-1,4-benzoquinol methylase
MAEATTGIRSLLSRPTTYLLLQRMLGLRRLHRHLLANCVTVYPGMRVLDIGCGPGSLLESLRDLGPKGDISYDGFDLSAPYIDFAERKFGKSGNHRFWCKRVGEESVSDGGQYDLIVAIGILHHLDDAEAQHLCAVARARLAPGGRFVTVDCCLADGQAKFARFMVLRDRGQNIREPEGYRALAKGIFGKVQLNVRHDLLNVPYTHTIMEMTDPLPAN